MKNSDGIFLLLRRLRSPLICLILVYAVAVIGLVLIPGNHPDGRPWHMDFLHAFYFVSFLGTTIGLGEIPHPFNSAQRLWVTGTIYTTVVAWLYAIGALLSALQDPMFRRVMREQRFTGAVGRLYEPFVLICGYGDAGHIVARELAEEGTRLVVVDRDADRVDSIEVSRFNHFAIACAGDASIPDTLEKAGLINPHCSAILALTGDDDVNTKIALTATLLKPEVPLFVSVQDHLRHPRLIAAGADHLVNPHDIFAHRLALYVRAPSLHVIYECLTTQAGRATHEATRLPEGLWVICGQGLFERVLRRHLERLGRPVRVIGSDPSPDRREVDLFEGDPTDPAVLREAGLREASVVVACGPSDIDNLAIVLAARDLNRDAFIIASQMQRRNTRVFRKSPANLVVLSGYLTAAEILRHLRAPLLAWFLHRAGGQDEPWAAGLLNRMRESIGDQEVDCWVTRVSAEECPMIHGRLAQSEPVALAALGTRPGSSESINCIPLVLARDGHNVLLPPVETLLQAGDEILYCGDSAARAAMRSRRNSRLFLEEAPFFSGS